MRAGLNWLFNLVSDPYSTLHHHTAILAALLGSVHSGVGAFDKRLSRFITLKVDNAETYGRADALAVDYAHALGFEMDADSLCSMKCLVL